MNKEKLKKGVDEDLKKVEKKSKAFWKEFKEFAIKGNAIDLHFLYLANFKQFIYVL